MTRKELKSLAKDQLQGKWTWAVGVTFIAFVVNFVLSWCSAGFLANLIGFSVYFAFLDLVDGKYQKNVFTATFSAFTNKRILPTLLTSMLAYIFTFFWTLLFIIPGIVKSYSYAMSAYIVKDLSDAGKEITATQAIRESRKLMDGHKAELFMLDLSFIGWWLLSLLTAGIGFFWLAPYYRATKANYYRKLAGNKFLN